MTEQKVSDNDEFKLEAEFMKNHPKFQQALSLVRKSNQRHPLYDLTSSEQAKCIRDLSNQALSSNAVDLTNPKSIKSSLQALYDLEYGCFENDARGNEKYSLVFYSALHNARSRLSMELMKQKGIKFDLTIIVPMWGEQNRMQSKADHETGEDFIRRKVSQMEWLFAGFDRKNMDYNLMFVDDGCPHNSGKEAIKLMDKDKAFFTDAIRSRISVEFLEEGLKSVDKFKKDPNLNTVNDSRKGGAVQYGMYVASAKEQSGDKERYIMYTDADLSADIAQSGLLLLELTVNNIGNARKVCVADRYSKGIFSKGDIMGMFRTNEVALSVRRLFRAKLLPPFANVFDSQCGFKLFTRDCVVRALPELQSYQSMFDMELICKSYDVYADDEKWKMDASQLICSAGVVWLHSAAASTISLKYAPNELKIDYGWQHYNMIRQMIDIHDRNYKESKACEKEWVQFIKALSWKEYYHIVQVVFLGGKVIKKWFPTIPDFIDILKEKYPDNAPEWKPIDL